jgi:hypothetical protein
MNPLWPMNIEPLPLLDAPTGDGEDCRIEFQPLSHSRVKALVFNEDNMIIDVFVAHDFMEAYDAVRTEFPQACWNPFEEEGNGNS